MKSIQLNDYSLAKQNNNYFCAISLLFVAIIQNIKDAIQHEHILM